MEMIKKRINKLENRSTEFSQVKQQKTDKIKQNFRDLWNN